MLASQNSADPVMRREGASMQHYPFVVDERPYCVWGSGLQDRNRHFLVRIDTEYFRFAADSFARNSTDQSALRVGLGLRLTYSHALEAFLALLFAGIQAPSCVLPWLARYTLDDLRALVAKVQARKAVLNRVGLDAPDWQVISRTVHRYLVLEDKEKEERIKSGFADFWTLLASEFASDPVHWEYNSIKHGMRVTPGGAHIWAGIEHEYAVPPPPNEIQYMGGSVFGTSFSQVERLGGLKTNIRLRRHARNWNPEGLFSSIDLIGMSIHNVVSYLQILNGTPPQEVRFVWPENLENFGVPLNKRPSLNDITMDEVIDESQIKFLSSEEILATYR
jgi:hypothetical protein